MTEIFFKDGKVLLDGNALRGCCCSTPPCISTSLEFYYYFPEGIPDASSSVTGIHYVSITVGAESAESSSETWEGQWPMTSDSGTGAPSGCPFYIGANPTASCYANGMQPGDGTGTFSFRDSRQDPNRTWTREIRVVLRILNDFGGSSFGVKIGDAVYRTTGVEWGWQRFDIGSVNKANNTTAAGYYTFEIVN